MHEKAATKWPRLGDKAVLKLGLLLVLTAALFAIFAFFGCGDTATVFARLAIGSGFRTAAGCLAFWFRIFGTRETSEGERSEGEGETDSECFHSRLGITGRGLSDHPLCQQARTLPIPSNPASSRWPIRLAGEME